LKQIFLVLFVVISCSLLAQTIPISGSTSVSVNQSVGYSVNLGSLVPVWSSWTPTGGMVQTSSHTNATILWTQALINNKVQYLMEDFYGEFYLSSPFNVTVAVPTPATTFTITQNCGSTTVQRNTSPESIYDWFWQTSSSGTVTTLGNGASINRTTAGTLYLRARTKNSPYRWSATSLSTGAISIVSIPPTVPATAINGHVIKNGNTAVPVSVSAVSGATNYKWYTQSSGGTAIAGQSTISYTPTVSQTTSYYVESAIGNCASTTRRTVVANVYPEPVISMTNNGMVSMGNKITASVSNFTYDTYQWIKNGIDISGATASSYATNVAGSYKVRVAKAGMSFTPTTTSSVTSGPTGQNLNYILSNTILKEGVTEADIDTLSVNSLSQTIQYFDGLGRPIQSVITQGSPDKKDIIQPVVYDAFGREAVKYLPFVSSETNGWYKQNALAHQSDFYNPNNPTPKVAADVAPFAVTVFEPSPLNRVIKQGAPGSAWQPDGVNTYNSTDHTIKKSYEFNTANEVLLWSYSYPTSANPFGMVNASSGATPIYYAANQLYKNRTKDEHGNEIIEYIDKEGKIILKRVQAVNGSPAMNDSTYASTYFIYNDFGKEVCVIPPEAVKRITKINSEYFGKTDVQKNDFLKRWAYRYTFDGRMRQTQKQLPGAESVYLVYNNRDLLVMTQDGNQRTQNKWTFTKYDVLNRPIITGIYTHNDSINQAAMSVLISTTNFFDSYTGNASFHGYSNNVFPTTNADSSPLEILSVTYYDNYRFRDDFAGSSYNYVTGDLTGQDTTAFNRVAGLATGTKVYMLNTNDYLWSVNYYDDKYRSIQTIAQNHKGGFDRITNKLDFVGKVLESKTTHNNSYETYTIKRRIEYDHGQRPLKTWHKVNDKPEVLLSAVEYNALSENVVKKLHSADNGVSFKQHIDYRFGIRGWLTRINNADLTPDDVNEPKDLFGMNLSYNDAASGINNTPQFNGNISAAKYSTNLGLGAQSGAASELGYKFSYDPMNRLTASTHVEKNVSWNISTSYHEDNLTYNLNGSPLSVNRKGEGGATIDQLTYVYNGNQVQKITDASDKAKGFVDGVHTGNDYTYNANSNRVGDANKDLTTIYNYLNLPEKMTKGTGEYIQYVYNAVGNKLSQSVYNASHVLQKKTDYVGEYYYENDTLKFIHHEEGRIIPEGNGSFTYQYSLRDHLANERLVFTTKQEQDESLATMEDANATSEQGKFVYYNEALKINSTLFDHTNAGTTHYAIRLNGSPNERYGLAKSLSVMPGDTIRAEVYAKYLDTNSNNWTTALTNLIAAIAGGTTPAGTVVDGGAAGSTGGATPSFIGLLNKESETGTAPKAYLNYLIFDRNFVLLNSGFVRMSENAREYGQDGAHEKLEAEFVITQPGYVYIYLSNDNAALGGSLTECYFDDLKITQSKSSTLQEDFYYPFGAVAKSAVREDAFENKFLYQGKEYVKDLGVEQYDNEWRWYDPWGLQTTTPDPHAENYYSISQYSWAGNNPITMIDPDGQDYGIYFDHEKKTITIRATYYATSSDHQEAINSTNYWNNQSGNFTYTIGGGDDAITYSVNFELTTVEVKGDVTALDMAFQKDKSGEANIFMLVSDGDKRLGTNEAGNPNNGNTKSGKYAFIRNDRSGTETGAHEIGHTLGITHNSNTKSGMRVGGNFDGKAPGPVTSDISSMLKYPLRGKVNYEKDGNPSGKGTSYSGPVYVNDFYPDWYKHNYGSPLTNIPPAKSNGKEITLKKGKVK
jgi:RHS repeat-associated protein